MSTPTLTGLLGVMGNALDVFQQGLTVVQNNVDNSSTPGYATQSLNLEALPLDVTDGLAGGVASAGLDNSRDQYAEQQVQQQTQTLGKYTSQAQTTGSIQSLFNASGTGGVAAAVSQMFQSFSAWSVSPSDPTVQQSVIASAQDVASSIQSLANSLSQNAEQIGASAASTTTQINSIAGQIESYNEQRLKDPTPDPGQDAKLYSSLDNLSQLTNFSTVTQANGTVSVMLAGGSPLVLGSQQYDLSATSSPDGTQVLDSQGQDVTSQINSGQLGGLLDVRNRVLGSMLGNSTQTGTLNQFAAALADNVNQILQSGTVSTSPGAASGAPLFTYNSSTPNDAATSLAVNPSITGSQLAPVDSSGNSNGNANLLAGLGNTALTQLGGSTLTQYFGQITSNIGQENQTATGNQQSQQQVVAQATTLVNQVSGVSLDQQAVQVIQFQRAYQAAAQVLTVVNNLAETVMNLIPPY